MWYPVCAGSSSRSMGMRGTWSPPLLMVCFVPSQRRDGVRRGCASWSIRKWSIRNMNKTQPSGSGSSCSIIYTYEHNNVHKRNVHKSNVPLIIRTGCGPGHSHIYLVTGVLLERWNLNEKKWYYRRPSCSSAGQSGPGPGSSCRCPLDLRLQQPLRPCNDGDQRSTP